MRKRSWASKPERNPPLWADHDERNDIHPLRPSSTMRTTTLVYPSNSTVVHGVVLQSCLRCNKKEMRHVKHQLLLHFKNDCFSFNVINVVMHNRPHTEPGYTAALLGFAYFLSQNYQISPLAFFHRSPSISALAWLQKLLSALQMTHHPMPQVSSHLFNLTPSVWFSPGFIFNSLFYSFASCTLLQPLHWPERNSLSAGYFAWVAHYPTTSFFLRTIFYFSARETTQPSYDSVNEVFLRMHNLLRRVTRSSFLFSKHYLRHSTYTRPPLPVFSSTSLAHTRETNGSALFVIHRPRRAVKCHLWLD